MVLGTILNGQPSDANADGPHRCCPARLHLPPTKGQWLPEDGAPPPSEIVSAEFHHNCVTVELRRCTWPHRLRLQLRADHEGQETAQFELEIQIHPRFIVKVCRAGTWDPYPWGLTAGITRVSGDPFSEARTWIYHALTPLRSPTPRRTADPNLSKTMTLARAYIHESACAAVALLNSGVRKVLLRFPNHMRAWLYQALATDASGRLAQLAKSHPGVLTFAYALGSFGRRAGCTRSANQALRGIIDGRPLKQLLDEAVRAWAKHAGKGVGRSCTADGYLRNWQCLVECQEKDRQALFQAQRLLIRRAGAGVPSLTLWLPPPPAFAPEDIPQKKLANARWFRVMKCLRPVLALRNNIRPEHAVTLCMFISRHALKIGQSKELGNSDYGRIRTLLDYAHANNHWPLRSTPGAGYLAVAEAWHRRFQEIQHLAELAAETGESLVGPDGNSLPFPEPPCPGWRSGEDTMVPLRTVEEVLAEGNNMHNCVASRVGEAITGRAFLYHGRVRGKPLTIQIAEDRNSYRLVEAAGSSNEKLTAAQKRIIGKFIAHISPPRMSDHRLQINRFDSMSSQYDDL